MRRERVDAARLAGLTPIGLARELALADETTARHILAFWPFWARPAQLPPPGDWRVWLMMAGRGFGKTRAGAEWVRGLVEGNRAARVALVAATLDEGRAVMIEGESGLLAIAPDGRQPVWQPSLRRLKWPGGGTATLYSAAEPESLRGPQHGYAWADEIAKWPAGRAAWDNLALGLRLGKRPRVVATTTPRPVPLVRWLMARADVVVTQGRTEDNAANLSADFLASVTALYGGTRLGRQELDGELIEEVEGALWTRALLERCRARQAPALARVVIGVDPPAGVGGDACGIVACALGEDGRGFVLADDSVAGATPEGWARAVAASAARHGADRVVAEANQGGAMVSSVLRAADAVLPVKLVHATRGKSARAEPVAALYEAGRVAHVGAFPALEDEMAGMQAGGGYAGPGRSPDRADALVWALTALMLGGGGTPGLRRL
ncbi:DNA-packaging protein [Sphingomonas sp.]|uniref:DNA-packaging protein n=1 Tax=Sphingomonas sp. TaxID=28214 RepID=UPI003AFF73E8